MMAYAVEETNDQLARIFRCAVDQSYSCVLELAAMVVAREPIDRELAMYPPAPSEPSPSNHVVISKIMRLTRVSRLRRQRG